MRKYSSSQCRRDLALLRAHARRAGELVRSGEWADAHDILREIESQASAIAATIWDERMAWDSVHNPCDCKCDSCNFLRFYKGE